MNAVKTVRWFVVLLLLMHLFTSCNKNSASIPPVVPPDVQHTVPDSVMVRLRYTLPAALQESSGLCYTDGALWSFGDSGNPNAVYKIDTASGAILQEVSISNYPNTDWEDITADEQFIYIGDVGNNLGYRKDLRILRVKKSDLLSNAASLQVQAEVINYSYADQIDFAVDNNTNFNCEALIAAGDSLYLFSKDGSDLFTRCYSLSKQPGTYTAVLHSTFNVEGRITAAAYNATTKELALLGYLPKRVDSFIWFFDGFADHHFFDGTSKKFIIGKPAEDWQTEALAYLSADRLMMTCETSNAHTASLYDIYQW